MHTPINKKEANKRESVVKSISQNLNDKEASFQFVDNRPEVITQRKLQLIAKNYHQSKQTAMNDQPIQKKENSADLSDQLKSGAEIESTGMTKFINDHGEESGVGKAEFLIKLKSKIFKVADEILAQINQTANHCPYILKWFSHYSGQEAAYIEKAIARYAPETQSAANIDEYIERITNRVKKGLQNHVKTGSISDVPSEIIEKQHKPEAFLHMAQKPQNVAQLSCLFGNQDTSTGESSEEEVTPINTGGMKRSTRMYGLNVVGNASSATQVFRSGEQSREVSIGYLRSILESTLDEYKSRYNILERLLEEIGGNSKGHQLITDDPDLLKIFEDVCAELEITVKWTGLNTN